MSKEMQFGCKKCGSVVAIQVTPWSDRVDIRVKDGHVRDHFGKIEISCKKCDKLTATLVLEQA